MYFLKLERSSLFCFLLDLLSTLSAFQYAETEAALAKISEIATAVNDVPKPYKLDSK